MAEPELPNSPRPLARPPVRLVVTTAGIILAVVLIVLGLVIVGCIVFCYVAMSNFGSNK